MFTQSSLSISTRQSLTHVESSSPSLPACAIATGTDAVCDVDGEAAANTEAARRFKSGMHLEPPLSRWVRNDTCCVPSIQMCKPATSLKDGLVVSYENACANTLGASTRETWRVGHYMTRLHQQSKYERTIKRLVASESRYARIQAELVDIMQRTEVLLAEKVRAENEQLRLFAEAYRERLRAWLAKTYMTSTNPTEWKLTTSGGTYANPNCNASTIPGHVPIPTADPVPSAAVHAQSLYGVGGTHMQTSTLCNTINTPFTMIPPASTSMSGPRPYPYTTTPTLTSTSSPASGMGLFTAPGGTGSRLSSSLSSYTPYSTTSTKMETS